MHTMYTNDINAMNNDPFVLFGRLTGRDVPSDVVASLANFYRRAHTQRHIRDGSIKRQTAHPNGAGQKAIRCREQAEKVSPNAVPGAV